MAMQVEMMCICIDIANPATEDQNVMVTVSQRDDVDRNINRSNRADYVVTAQWYNDLRAAIIADLQVKGILT